MKIICPKCYKENEVSISNGTVCVHCQKSLEKYTFKKTLIPGALLVAMGVGISHGYEYYKDSHIVEYQRYPVKIEYALVDKCLTSYNSPMSRISFNKKRDACINAVEQVQEEISYPQFQKNQKAFMEAFSLYAAGFVEK
ncbi:hypothetical protein JWJ90_10540 [Desulfobulbus rhabdoformis]|uniref:hypothetical protein n=1 Tax=Desulfobulbus rhabdoformis TaxID=34032 RepID=UPI001966915F|nr:hypothetical protein [Desulfobulbus rhabdoformis]MBM9614723.1 hypothetical protein [Desulfobulbus rhabdoformis]